jgi:hypothetical protein
MEVCGAWAWSRSNRPGGSHPNLFWSQGFSGVFVSGEGDRKRVLRTVASTLLKPDFFFLKKELLQHFEVEKF